MRSTMITKPKNTKKRLLMPIFILVSCLCQNVLAQGPDSGWWWNANESGRGYAIERQGDTLFFASFLYDESGFPSWYTATLNRNNQQGFSGILQQYQGGQTLYGDYQQPVADDANAGDITLDFSDSGNGTITWPGGIVAITRFAFAEDTNTENNDQRDSRKPEKGWWWNQDQSGRGFAVEQQGDKIFFAAFLYDGSGLPTWYTSTLKKGDQEYNGILQQFKGGQTLIGSYQSPEMLNENAGEITLVFSDSGHGKITWPGGTVAINRFHFSTDDNSGNDDRNGSDDDRNGDNNDHNGSDDDRNGDNDDRNGSDDDRNGDNDDRNGSGDDRNGHIDDRN
jgi:hypothetical protein